MAGGRSLLGVYRDREAADRAAAAARDAGVAPTGIRVGTGADRITSERAEMDREVADSWASPAAPVWLTKEMAGTAILVSVVAAIVGALLALPLAALTWGTDLGLGARLLIAAICGGACGWAVGFVIGGGWARRRDRALAAERGITVRVADDRPEVEEALRAAGPLRLDVVQGDVPVRPVAAEHDRPQDALRPFPEELRKGDGADAGGS